MTLLNIYKLILLHLMVSCCLATSRLIETAVNITSTYYNHHFATTVIWKRFESEYVNEFLMSYPGAVVLNPWQCDNENYIRDFNETMGFRQTIYFSTSLLDYTKFMRLLNEVVRFPIRFILVLEKPVKTFSVLTDFIEVSSKNDQADLVIISENDASEVTLSTFFPYSDRSCGNHTPVFLAFGDEMFPKKFRNFYQCPVRTALFDFVPYVVVKTVNTTIDSIGGYDGKILKIVLDKLNASLEVTSFNNFEKFGTFVNATATGSIGDLASAKADILIPAGILTEKRYSVTLPSHTHHTIDIRWVGRKQQEVYDYLKFIVPDRTNFTPIHGLTFILFVIVAMIIRKCKTNTTGAKNHVLNQSFIILLGQSAKFVTKSSLLNSLFMLWIWFCFIYRIDYQADLVEALQAVDLEPPLKSVEEAVTKVDSYGGAEIFLEFYKGTPLEHNYKVISVDDIQSYVQRIIEGENFLLATDTSFIQDISKQFQILEKPISIAETCFYMRPGWPAAKDFDDVIFSLIEAGFIEKIFRKDNRNCISNEKNNEDKQLTPQGLSMTKLSVCFYGLVIMWVICSIILLIEIIYHKLWYKKH